MNISWPASRGALSREEVKRCGCWCRCASLPHHFRASYPLDALPLRFLEYPCNRSLRGACRQSRSDSSSRDLARATIGVTTIRVVALRLTSTRSKYVLRYSLLERHTWKPRPNPNSPLASRRRKASGRAPTTAHESSPARRRLALVCPSDCRVNRRRTPSLDLVAALENFPALRPR
jgi:hypothetical protein